jgi:hypothetical protein
VVTLAEVRVLLASHRHLRDSRVLHQRDLHLAGADLVAGGLDQVGGEPAHDPQVAVLRARGQVAREEPSVAHGLAGRVRAVEIPGEQVRAAHRDLAERLVVGGLHVPAVVADEPDLDAVEGRADVAGATLAVGSHGGVHERLGQAVALDDLPAREPLDLLEVG